MGICFREREPFLTKIPLITEVIKFLYLARFLNHALVLGVAFELFLWQCVSIVITHVMKRWLLSLVSYFYFQGSNNGAQSGSGPVPEFRFLFARLQRCSCKRNSVL